MYLFIYIASKKSYYVKSGSHAPVRHWVLGNIDGLSLQLGVIPDASVTVSPFKGPSPPYGSHRYGFFLFRQFEGSTKILINLHHISANQASKSR